jgi:hypothetical protein
MAPIRRGSNHGEISDAIVDRQVSKLESVHEVRPTLLSKVGSPDGPAEIQAKFEEQDDERHENYEAQK